MWLWALAAVAGGALLIDRVAVLTMRPPRRSSDRRAADLGYPVTPVEIEVEEGKLTLRGDLLEPRAADPEAPLVVLVHGWTGDSTTMLHVAEPLLAAGFPTFVFDVRSHGRSDAAPAVTVRHFRDDLLAVLERLEASRPDRPIVVVGHSLGGSAGILAAARGARLGGLALVAAPADLFAATAGFFSDHGLPGSLLVRLLHPSWRLRAGESFRHLDPEARARDIAGQLPITLLQGEDDTRVPPSDAVRLSEASGVPVVRVRGAAHRDILAHPVTHRELLRFVRSVSGTPA
jgi:pimeloyl-ACP methyl ester carboxylesterase